MNEDAAKCMTSWGIKRRVYIYIHKKKRPIAIRWNASRTHATSPSRQWTAKLRSLFTCHLNCTPGQAMISFIHVIRSIFISKKTLEEQAGHSPILTRSCIFHHQTCLLDGEIKQSNKINTKSGKLIKMGENFTINPYRVTSSCFSTALSLIFSQYQIPGTQSRSQNAC